MGKIRSVSAPTSPGRRGELVDLELEREVIGGVYYEPGELERLDVVAEDFHAVRHQHIFRAIRDCRDAGLAIDLRSVLESLKARGLGELVSVRDVSEAVDHGISLNLPHFVRRLRTLAIERRMQAAQESLGMALAEQDHGLVSQRLEELQGLYREHAQIESRMALRTLGERKEAGEDWLDSPPPAAEVLLRHGGKPLMRDGRVALLVAAGGAGKSYVLADLALSVGAGVPWLSTFAVERQGRVAVAFAEEDEDEIRRRLWALASAKRMSDYERAKAERNVVPIALRGQDTSFLRKGPDGNITTTAWFEAFKASLTRSGPWRLIILDPWSRWGGPDVENDAYVATRGVQCIEQLTSLPGNPAVIIAHHSRKATSDGPLRRTRDASNTRGTSALVDGVRLVLEMTRRLDSDLLDIEVTKANYTVPSRLTLTRNDSGVLRPASVDEIQAYEDERAERKRGKP